MKQGKINRQMWRIKGNIERKIRKRKVKCKRLELSIVFGAL